MKRSDLYPDLLASRKRRDRHFARLSRLAAGLGVLALMVLIGGVLRDGLPWLNADFLEHFASRRPSQAGFKAAFYGSLWLIGLTTLVAVPIGVLAAIYLEEYAGRGRFAQLLELLIANLAGVPSILYGMLGLIAFVRMFDLFEKGTTWLGIPLPFGRSVFAGALTLSLLVLPVLIIATREALRAVPDSRRQAAFGLGATRWQCIWHHVLPAALPGIQTGVILSLSRALGETAPLVMMGALTYVAFTPESIFDSFTAMPIQIFNWANRPQVEFHGVASAGILVLLGLILCMNTAVLLLRSRVQKGK